MKKTRWFPMSTPPSRKGVYEIFVKNTGVIGWFAKWDGRVWYSICGHPVYAAEMKVASASCYIKGRKWRGLAEKPSK